jgi:hypothetical protein
VWHCPTWTGLLDLDSVNAGPADPGPTDPGSADPGSADSDPSPADTGPADPGADDLGPADPGQVWENVRLIKRPRVQSMPRVLVS